MDSLVQNSSWTAYLVDLKLLRFNHTSPVVYATVILGLSVLTIINPFRTVSKIPLVNPPSRFEILGKARRQEFSRNASKHIARGRELYPDKPFRLITDTCDLTVLPAEWAHDIRNEPNLHFMKVVHDEFHADLPAFYPFAAGTNDDALFQTIARKQLTKFLSHQAIGGGDQLRSRPIIWTIHWYDYPKQWPDRQVPSCSIADAFLEWHEIYLRGGILDIVARTSSCVFLGPELCRNEAWLSITKKYTVDAVFAAEELRTYPKWMRGIVHLFLAKCNLLRSHISEARSIINPFIEKKRTLRKQNNGAATGSITALDWFEEEAAGRPYDPALSQMILSVAAIHTTSDLLNEVLLRLADRPELVEEIRQEVVRVLRADGWTKNSLYNMQLLDSVIKESQRLLTPPVNMARKAIGTVVLPDGSVVYKGQRVAVSTTLMRSAKVYDNPDEFDGHRFYRMRKQPETENQAHLVSTGPASLNFGHGMHSCPGRFFAANEIKVILCHLLTKYDFKLPEGYIPRPYESSIGVNSDPMSRLVVRRRKEDIEIDSL